ncbi:MAG: protein kinase, partial [Planctomycetota bacterium]
MEPATASPGEVDTLLERVLEQPESEWPRVLDSLCGEHPHAAASLRRRFSLLAEVGVVAGAPRPEFLAPGQPFGAYQLLELLGAGGMGVVFRARRDGAGEDVALKVLRPELLAHDTVRTRFLREGAALSGVRHPALCALVDFGDHAGVPFLAMQLVRGASLAAAVVEAR